MRFGIVTLLLHVRWPTSIDQITSAEFGLIFRSLPVLIVNGVWFPGLMPSQVSDVLGKAIDELKAR
jgi:hypothetical protein